MNLPPRRILSICLFTTLFLLSGCSTKHQKTAARFDKDFYYMGQEAATQFRKGIYTFENKVRIKWGGETKTPSSKEFVKYSKNYVSRAVVNFEAGRVTVETVDDNAPEASLKQAIVAALLTPDDPHHVELYSDKDVEFVGEPYLYGDVKDQDGQPVRWPWRANRFADYLVEKEMKQRNAVVGGKSVTVSYVTIPMVKGHLNVQADKYRDVVLAQAKRFGVEPSLVYAIMETESSFNPYAVSPVPAYGLMQIVPSTAGRDAWKKLKGRDGMPTRKYLFNAHNNIEMGAAYLSILQDSYLSGVKNKKSREYCVIAAYNTGSGNVFRTFSRSRKNALSAINSLSPDQVFYKLKTSLPYEETRRYVKKVSAAKKKYGG